MNLELASDSVSKSEMAKHLVQCTGESEVNQMESAIFVELPVKIEVDEIHVEDVESPKNFESEDPLSLLPSRQVKNDGLLCLDTAVKYETEPRICRYNDIEADHSSKMESSTCKKFCESMVIVKEEEQFVSDEIQETPHLSELPGNSKEAFGDRDNLKPHFLTSAKVNQFDSSDSRQSLSQGMSRVNYLEEAVVSKDTKELLKCVICCKIYATREDFISHSKTHSKEKQFKCSKCDKVFSGNKAFVNHMRMHIDTRIHLYKSLKLDYLEPSVPKGKRKLLVCVICGKVYTSNEDFITHSKTHSKEKQFKCSKCDEVFSGNKAFVNHMRMHTEERRLLFNDLKILPPEKFEFKCKDCNRLFKHKQNLLNHQKIHCKKRYRCECGMIYSDKNLLLDHMQIHSEVNRYKYRCSYCGMTYSDENSLMDHLQIHSEENSYKYRCSDCGMTYCDKKLLMDHLQIHSEEKSYKYRCVECGVSYPDKRLHLAHLQVHAEEKGRLNECGNSVPYN